MAPQVIHYDYDLSPYGQKTKLLLTAAGVKYTKNDQPPLLPRPDLEALGITYRRIPVLSVGKDFYADSSLIVDVIVSKLGKIETSPADKAYEAWGATAFQEGLGLVPGEVLTPEFVNDRKTVFPVLNRPDVKQLGPSTLAAFRQRLDIVENTFLSGSGPFIGGSQISLADVHVFWSVRWFLETLGVAKQPGFAASDYPKIYKAIAALPPANPEVTSFEDTQKIVKDSEYFAHDVAVQVDPTGFAAGAAVNVESLDAEPGSHPQKGKLVGLNASEIVLEVTDGNRLHFPRIGYLLKPQ